MSYSEPKCEKYRQKFEWLAYSLSWCANESVPLRLAVGSFVEEYKNEISITQLKDNTLDGFEELFKFEHPYPPTKIMWIPDSTGSMGNKLATSGDYLRIWSINDECNKLSSDPIVMNNNKSSEYCAPLTNFDWSEKNPNLLATCSIDTTITCWDIPTSTVSTQLIAHDKEVFDVSFNPSNPQTFASCGADGSVRTFDLRNLEHSVILYESSGYSPLLRLDWNKQDSNYLACVAMDSKTTIVLDKRVPTSPVELKSHSASINDLKWAPHSSCHICTASDDRNTMIWDLSSLPEPISSPSLAYKADSAVNSLQWSTAHPEWIAICFENVVETLRV